MSKTIKKINKFNLGAYNRMPNKFENGGKEDSKASKSNGLMSGIGAAAGALTNAMAGGNSTGVGNAMQSIGSAASAIPGVGGLIGAGVNVLGGVVNTLFGSNINEAAVNTFTNKAQQTGGIQMNANSNTELLNQMNNSQQMSSISKKDIGTEGWFSNAASDKAAAINADIALNNRRQSQAFNIGANNLSNTQNANAMMNFKSLGGTLESDFSNGITSINKGGTHEQNPNQGIAISKDKQGTPNLVEEGEIIFKDYVFSNRLKVPKKTKKDYKLKGNSFADSVEKLQKESEERPNDPISKRGLEDSINRLIPVQEEVRAKKKEREINNLMSKLSPRDMELLQEQQTMQAQQQDQIPQDQIPQDQVPQEQINNQFETGGYTNKGYTPNLKFDLDYAEMPYGDPVKWSENRIFDFNKNEIPLDDFNSKISHKFKSNTPYESNILKSKYSKPIINRNKINTPTTTKEDMDTPISTNKKKNFLDSLSTDLRYAPILGTGINTITDAIGLTNKPNYASVDKIGAAIKNIKDPSYKPVGNYLSYNPMDTDYYINKLNADSAATISAITNNSGGNRGNAMAGILAADYNYGNSLGVLAKQGEEYNAAQREKVEGFNRGTNIANSEMDLKAQAMGQHNTQFELNAAIQQANLREQIANRADMAKSTNLTNLFDSIGDVGRENLSRNMVNSNNSQYYGTDRHGNMYYKDAYNKASKEEQDKIDSILGVKVKKNGGYLMTKSKKNGI